MQKCVLQLLCLFTASSSLAAQDFNFITPDSHNVSLLSHLEIKQGGQVRRDVMDVWGYVDSNTGREYALVGYGLFTDPPNAGVSIVDVTEPTDPFEVANIDSVPGFDVKVWGHYLYSVNGLSSGEGKIVDIADPTNPRVVGAFPSAHNIFISADGYLYLESPGLNVFSLNLEPTYPMFVWSAGVEGHDAAVIGNRLYDFHGISGTNIFDVSDPVNPKLLGSIQDPSIAYHHSGWTTEDGNYLFICDELAKHPSPDITVWDIRDPANPERVGQYADSLATVHNLYIKGGYAYVSYYTSGYVILDVSNPTQPRKIADFDTAPNFEGQGFDGAFGVYTFSPSGNIFVSDEQNGLFIFAGIEAVTHVQSSPSQSPAEFKLFANYPNPFNPQTTISYQIPQDSQVALTIFNTIGQKVRTLVNETQSAGLHRVVWDGRDDFGNRVPSGVYFYRLRGGKVEVTRRLILLQ